MLYLSLHDHGAKVGLSGGLMVVAGGRERSTESMGGHGWRLMAENRPDVQQRTAG